jgi:DNA (cytosine-5)-methyltransferase 1
VLTGVSLFAGVGGFDLAMQRNGIDVVAAVEIDAKARSVLARHFPESTLFNDVTEVTGDDLRRAGFVPERGVITGGFPCQDLSVAGRRAGLAGARSGLFWEIVRLVDDLHPRWLVLENVPGLLSSNGGRDMGVVLGALGDLGYGWAYRVLDAQHFGVPQRRRRVFIVAGRRAGAADYAGPVQVLLEPEGVRGNPAPGHAAGQDVAGTLGGGSGSRGWAPDTERMTFVPVAADLRNGVIDGDVTHTLQAKPGEGVSLNCTPAVIDQPADSLSRLASSSGMQHVASTVTTGTGQRMDPDTESLVVT